MFCQKCGTQIADGQSFCTNCGAPMGAQTPAQPAQPVQPAYNYAPAQVVPGKGLGVAGMVLGIIALVLFCIWYISLPCAIIGVILSAVSLKKAKEAGVKNGMATAGVVCSCIALALMVLYLVIAGVMLAEFMREVEEFQRYL